MRIVLRQEDIADILRQHTIEKYNTLDVVATVNGAGDFVVIVNENEAERIMNEGKIDGHQ